MMYCAHIFRLRLAENAIRASERRYFMQERGTSILNKIPIGGYLDLFGNPNADSYLYSSEFS